MNYQRGMLSDLAPQNNDGLARLLMYLNQPQPMMTGPMMLAQNTQNPNQLQRMLGVRGDGVSSQTKIGIEKSLPGFYETKAPEPDAKGYSIGSDAPGQKSLEQRQRNESAKKLNLPPGKDYSEDEIRAATLRRNSAVR